MLVSRKRRKIETYFQWKTNRKSNVAYRLAPVLVTLNNLEGHSPVAGLFKCNPSKICAAFYQISTDSVLARSLSNSWASCLSYGRQMLSTKRQGPLLKPKAWLHVLHLTITITYHTGTTVTTDLPFISDVVSTWENSTERWFLITD